MPLNPSKVKDQAQLLSSLNVDKVVRVFEDSFNASTDVITVNYTFLGFPNPIEMYRFAHGLPRPVFCDLLWSLNGSTFYDGGSGGNSTNTTIAFSDDTYIYIPRPVTTGTVYYKVICTWIDSYDTTNPFIESIMYRNKSFSLDSRLNYQKIFDQDVDNVTASGLRTIVHPLKYAPNAKVFIEALPNQVWPLNFGGTAGNPFLYDDNQIEVQLFIENSDIIMDVTYPFSASGARRLWYRIYYDD
jgi:hypothetical protein